MIVSLNEIAATAAKAVRGRGHSVGIAEDMGFAARWLSERGLLGVDELISALDDFEPVNVVVRTDGEGDRRILDPEGNVAVPALRVAPSVIELLVASGSPGRSVRIRAVTHPLLVAPFAARAGRRGHEVMLEWSSPDGPVRVEAARPEPRIRAESTAALTATSASDMVARLGSTPSTAPPVLLNSSDLRAASKSSIANGCQVDDRAWNRLGKLAHETYVPVSDESRLRGAGAGLTDND